MAPRRDPMMQRELEARGGDGRGHLSRPVSADILASADLVLTAEFAHRLRISQQWPDQAPKVFGLLQFADALSRTEGESHGLAALDAALAVAPPDSLAWDHADPYRQGRTAARLCADTIDDALAVILPRLAGIPALLHD